MRNLLYEPLPDSVEIDGKKYRIITDFREWLRFSDLLGDDSVDERQKLSLMLEWFEEPPPPGRIEEAISALIAFCANADKTEKKPKKHSNSGKKILSWSFDSPYIYAAFLSVYRIDLLNVKYMHWHMFLALFNALPEDTPIRQRMAYRAVNTADIKDKKERQRIRRIQSEIRIPSKPMSAADIGAAFG